MHMLAKQLWNPGKPPAGAPHKPCKEQSALTSPNMPSIVEAQKSAAMNLAPMSRSAPPKPMIPQTIVPQVHTSDQKGKTKDTPTPDFNYQCSIEDKTDAKKIYKCILDISIPRTACELLLLLPEVQKQVEESTTMKKGKAATFVAIYTV